MSPLAGWVGGGPSTCQPRRAGGNSLDRGFHKACQLPGPPGCMAESPSTHWLDELLNNEFVAVLGILAAAALFYQLAVGL